jgi:hypothetical protein
LYPLYPVSKRTVSQAPVVTPVILATQEAEIRRIAVLSQAINSSRPYLENASHIKGLSALSASPSTSKKKKKRKERKGWWSGSRQRP